MILQSTRQRHEVGCQHREELLKFYLKTHTKKKKRKYFVCSEEIRVNINIRVGVLRDCEKNFG